MPSSHALRLRLLVAAIGLMTSTLAGAGAEKMASPPPRIGEFPVHDAPRGDTPHDSFAALETPETRCVT